MKILLDTHTFLWQITDDKRLSKTARQALLSPDNDLRFSAASLWEIAIKVSLGRLQLADEWPVIIAEELLTNQIYRLPIEDSHCIKVSELPFHHRDPFDRMLVAQAMLEDLTLLSRDENISRYSINQLW